MCTIKEVRENMKVNTNEEPCFSEPENYTASPASVFHHSQDPSACEKIQGLNAHKVGKNFILCITWMTGLLCLAPFEPLCFPHH